jgi:hypothetical protein
VTLEDTKRILAVVRMLWPHSNLGHPGEATRVWHMMLERLDTADVEAAVKALATAGREHAPPVGVIVQAVCEHVTDAPDWDTAWRDIDRLIRRHGSYRVPAADAFCHPLVAAFAVPAWKELCAGPAPGTREHGTHYAQQREAYRAMRARAQRGVALEAVGAGRSRRVPRGLGDVLADAAPGLGQGQEAA